MEKGNTGRAVCEVAHCGEKPTTIRNILYTIAENVIDEFTDPIDLTHQAEVIMSEESDAEKIKLEDDLKKVLRQLRLVLRIYDPDKYEVDILVVNKDDWIKKVEDGYDNVLEVSFHIQGTKLWSAADFEKLTKSVDDLEKQVVDFVTRFNKKIMKHLHSASDGEILVHDLRPEPIAAETKAAKTAFIKSDLAAEDASIKVKEFHVENVKEADLCQPDTQTQKIVTSKVTDVSYSVLVVTAVYEHNLMLKETYLRKNLVVSMKDSFKKPVCINYFERGKINNDASASVVSPFSEIGCVNAPLPDLDQLNYPDVVLAETNTIADAIHD